MSDTLTDQKIAKRAERNLHPVGSAEYRRLNSEWSDLVEACAAAQTEPQPYIEDTTNADLARKAAREMVYDADLARQQTGPDPIETESHWYLMEGE